ncbi:hypothetical protein ACIO3O_37180 [Streptomyces sp. NPDC087440]|uniref:hypothetical protein n=1 Tax=Streptomyces sp. NPDC087440 TaxID=3365790 RepID=UPI00382B7BCD
MHTRTTPLGPALATGISDRAFRLYSVLVLTTSGGQWVTIPELAAACRLKPYEARPALSELRKADMVEADRRYVTGDTGRKTWRTYIRLPEDTASVFAPDHAEATA